MTTQDTYLNHARTQKWWQPELHGKTNTQVLKEMQNRPVCPKCERIAMRDKGWRAHKYSSCPHCGWHGATVTLDEVITEKLYR